MVDIRNLGISTIKKIQEDKNQEKLLKKKEMLEKITSDKRKNLINAVVCIEYGVEHFDVALNQDFKNTELQELKQDFLQLQNQYSKLRSKLEKFVGIESLEDDLYHLKDVFQMCLDEIRNGNVMFVDDKEIDKLKQFELTK